MSEPRILVREGGRAMSDETCGDCRFFAKEPARYSSYGACLDSFAMREDRQLGMVVAVYDATKTGRKACPDFEAKEAAI